MKKRTLAVGLTGGIGSGKSEVLRAFRRLGARTLCLDEAAHRVLARGGPAYGPVRRAFPGAVGPGGEIDRRTLGRAVFADARLRRRLERLTHPAILRELRRSLRGCRGVLVVDAPLLFEAGLEGEFDLTAVVSAKTARRLGRLRRRDGLPVSELRRRMAAQMPLARKARLADVVIPNDGSLGELRRRVRGYHKALELIHGG